MQYRGGVSTVGDIMMYVGDILSTVGIMINVGEYHDTCREYLEYRGGLS